MNTTTTTKALQAARECIHADRTSFADCSIGPGNTMEPDDAEALAEYDAVLAQVDEALAALQPQPAAAVSDEEWWHGVLGSAGSDLLNLAKQWSDNEVHVYQFVNEAEKIVKAAAQRAILAQRPQAVPMPWELLTDERIESEDFSGMYWLALKNGTVTTGHYQWRQGHDPYGFNTEEQGRISASDVSHIAPLAEPAHPGITQRADGGEA